MYWLEQAVLYRLHALAIAVALAVSTFLGVEAVLAAVVVNAPAV